MALGDTDVSICAHALLLLGEAEISSFSDGTARAGICDAIYSDIRAQALSMYPWSFSMKKVVLAQSVTAPINEWTYASPMPSDSLTLAPRAVFNSTSTGVTPLTSGWELYEAAVLTDQSIIVIDYQYQTDEADMPAHFVLLLKYLMAMHLAEPVTDQISKGQHWERIAIGNPSEGGRGGQFRQAAAIDGMGQPSSFIQDYPLIDARQTLS